MSWVDSTGLGAKVLIDWLVMENHCKEVQIEMHPLIKHLLKTCKTKSNQKLAMASLQSQPSSKPAPLS